jgi:hypothetical protein
MRTPAVCYFKVGVPFFLLKRETMAKKIKILGKEVEVGFCLAVELTYEHIAKKPFNVRELNMQENAALLYAAAIITYNPDSEITLDDLMYKAKGPEIAELSKAVTEAMQEWLEVPEVVKVDEPEPTDEADEKKN